MSIAVSIDKLEGELLCSMQWSVERRKVSFVAAVERVIGDAEWWAGS